MEPRFSSAALALQGIAFLFETFSSLLVFLFNSFLMNPIKNAFGQIKNGVNLIRNFVFSQIMKIIIFSLDHTSIGKIEGYLKDVKIAFSALQVRALLCGIFCQLHSILLNFISTKKIYNILPLPSVELLVTLAWTPLVTLDVVIQVSPFYSINGHGKLSFAEVHNANCPGPHPLMINMTIVSTARAHAHELSKKLMQVVLLAYTMAFQCTLYILYVGLFVLCHLVSQSTIFAPF